MVMWLVVNSWYVALVFLWGALNHTRTSRVYPDNAEFHTDTLRNRHVDEIIATLLRMTVI